MYWVYHPETHELLLSPLLQKKEVFETFPVFSPDGRKLYFCTAEAKPIPAEYKEIRYSLCSIDFNPEDGTFGEKIDTLVNAAAMKKKHLLPEALVRWRVYHVYFVGLREFLNLA